MEFVRLCVEVVGWFAVGYGSLCFAGLFFEINAAFMSRWRTVWRLGRLCYYTEAHELGTTTSIMLHDDNSKWVHVAGRWFWRTR